MSERAGREMQEAYEAHERVVEKIAPREGHESAIGDVIARLRESGYFKKSDEIETVFPEPANIKGWLSKGELPKGMGKAVARYDVTNVIADVMPAGVLKSGGQNPDKFYLQLLEKGYQVTVDPNFDKMDGEHDSVSYMVYEATPAERSIADKE